MLIHSHKLQLIHILLHIIMHNHACVCMCADCIVDLPTPIVNITEVALKSHDTCDLLVPELADSAQPRNRSKC